MIKSKIYKVIGSLSIFISLLSGLMTIDSWVDSKFFKDTSNVIIDKNYNINKIEVIEKITE